MPATPQQKRVGKLSRRQPTTRLLQLSCHRHTTYCCHGCHSSSMAGWIVSEQSDAMRLLLRAVAWQCSPNYVGQACVTGLVPLHPGATQHPGMHSTACVAKQDLSATLQARQEHTTCITTPKVLRCDPNLVPWMGYHMHARVRPPGLHAVSHSSPAAPAAKVPLPTLTGDSHAPA